MIHAHTVNLLKNPDPVLSVPVIAAVATAPFAAPAAAPTAPVAACVIASTAPCACAAAAPTAPVAAAFAAPSAPAAAPLRALDRDFEEKGQLLSAFVRSEAWVSI